MTSRPHARLVRRLHPWIAGVCLALAFADPLFAQSALERVRATGRLRIGIDATYPPFGIAEGGDFSGFDVDIGRAIARELRVEAALVNASFDGVFPALQNGSFDVVISAVTDPDRRLRDLLGRNAESDAESAATAVRKTKTHFTRGHLAKRRSGRLRCRSSTR